CCRASPSLHDALPILVPPAKTAGTLDGIEIGRRSDDADQLRIATSVTAQRAGRLLGEVHADLAEADLVLHLDERLGQIARVFGRSEEHTSELQSLAYL